MRFTCLGSFSRIRGKKMGPLQKRGSLQNMNPLLKMGTPQKKYPEQRWQCEHGFLAKTVLYNGFTLPSYIWTK